MTPDERRRLAEQIATNPLTDIILAEIEKDATERLIWATTEHDRVEAQSSVRAARSFASALSFALNTPRAKGAPV